MTKEFLLELQSSLYVHRPLPLHEERSLEAAFPAKEVLAAKPLYEGSIRVAQPRAEGTATLIRMDEILTMRAPLRADRWPEGAAPDGD